MKKHTIKVIYTASMTTTFNVYTDNEGTEADAFDAAEDHARGIDFFEFPIASDNYRFTTLEVKPFKNTNEKI